MPGKKHSAIISMVVVFVLLLLGCSKERELEDSSGNGLIIESIQMGLGGELNKTLVTYSFLLSNKTENPILIKEVEPILSEDLMNRIENKDQLINQVNQMIPGRSSKEISGSFYVRTQGLDKQGIINLNRELKNFKLITEQIIGAGTPLR